jgi:exopolysaccharide biosynthesis protein
MKLNNMPMNFLCFLIPISILSCSKDPSNKPDIKPRYSAITQKIVDSSNVIVKVFSDTTFQVYDGITETDVNYYNRQGLTTTAFILHVDLKKPNLSLRAATAFNLPAVGTLQTVTDMASYLDAPYRRVMAGTNGDFFNTSTYIPLGIVYQNGVAVKDTFSDNSAKPQQGLSFLAVLKSGRLFIGDRETDYPLMKDSLWNALGGGVFLVRDHIIVPQTITTITTRTAIGITDDNEIYFLIVDADSFYNSNGIDYEDLSSIMKALGVKDAINVDGGGSSTFVIKNPLANIWQVRNHPEDGAPRAIGTSWLVVATDKQ